MDVPGPPGETGQGYLSPNCEEITKTEVYGVKRLGKFKEDDINCMVFVHHVCITASYKTGRLEGLDRRC